MMELKEEEVPERMEVSLHPRRPEWGILGLRPSLPANCCVALGKSLPLSGPHLPQVHIKGMTLMLLNSLLKL